MKLNKAFTLFSKALVVYALLLGIGTVQAENIDPSGTNAQFAYSENTGWLNAEPGGEVGVHVLNKKLTGYIWNENVGWINLSPQNYGGVLNDGHGNLSGYAWSENVGWINFLPYHGGVRIDTKTGVFSGYAWGENIGWVTFASTHHNMTTSWREFSWILFYPAIKLKLNSDD